MSIKAVSPNGQWVFENGKLSSQEHVITPFALDFFERWTFAKFLQDDQIALAFETGQPWSEFGSYGDRYWGVQILTQAAQHNIWTLSAIEYDYRSFDESFIPKDIVWHPRGVLAWLDVDELYFQVLKSPRLEVPRCEYPPQDSETDLDYSYSISGNWDTLTLTPSGLYLIAGYETGNDIFDLKKQLRRRQNHEWEPFKGYLG